MRDEKAAIPDPINSITINSEGIKIRKKFFTFIPLLSYDRNHLSSPRLYKILDYGFSNWLNFKCFHAP
jgi:hypothetical protein